VQSDDRGHVERSRKDGRVVGAAAGVGGKTADLRPIHLRGQRRRQFVGNQHRRLVQLAQQVARRGHVAAEIHAQPPDQIADVAFPLAQIRIGHVVEHGAEFVERLLHRRLGVDAFAPDDVGGARHQHRVVEHQQLRVEERRHLRPPRRHPRPDLHELRARSAAAFVEPGQLVRHPRRHDLVAQHLCALDQNHGAPRDDAGRDADTGQPLHASSPNPDSTSAASAATASSSSEPSAEMVMVDPRAAASSRMPMMLLPSISR
jgi:hypothetical protein